MVTNDITCDGVGGIFAYQPRKGFRFSSDSLLLYLTVPQNIYHSILEIGAGSGIVSFLLARHYPEATVTAVELQQEMFDCLCKGIDKNDLRNSVSPLLGDIDSYVMQLSSADTKQARVDKRSILELPENTLYLEKPFDLIVCNPPYRASGSGRLSPHDSKNIAVYDDNLPPEKLFKVIRRLSDTSTTIAISYTHDRHDVYLHAAMAYDMYPIMIRSYMIASGNMITVTSFSRVRSELPEHRLIVEDVWKADVAALYERGTT